MKIPFILQRLYGLELSVIFVTFALLGAIFGFVLLLDEVQSGATAQFDETILLALRDSQDLSDPWGPGWIEEMGRDFTALGGFPVLILLTLAILGFLYFHGQRRLALFLLVATLVSILLSSALKETIDRARPDLVPHKTQVYTASFPSGHAMHAAATYLTLGALLARFQRRRRLKICILSFAVLTTFLVGASRVYLGVHWPTDVLGGWAAGTGCALLTVLLARWLLKNTDVDKGIAEESEESNAALRGDTEFYNVTAADDIDRMEGHQGADVPGGTNDHKIT